jgi:hypothetical protein
MEALEEPGAVEGRNIGFIAGGNNHRLPFRDAIMAVSEQAKNRRLRKIYRREGQEDAKDLRIRGIKQGCAP